MALYNSFNELELNNENTDGLNNENFTNCSKKISMTIGYLLGVKEEFIERIDTEDSETIEKLKNNCDANLIRSLNNIRSNIILNFKLVSRTIRIDSPYYQPMYFMDMFKDDFSVLRRQEINIDPGKNDLKEYLRKINTVIMQKIDTITNLFPDWIDFHCIKYMFNMQDIDEEIKKYQINQNYYPFKRYFYWVYPETVGNLLCNDKKLLSILYQNCGLIFTDISRVVDVSEKVKSSINDFIGQGKKIQIFIDGENVSPYNVSNTLYGLDETELEKIEKIIVYYDSMYSPKAWLMLQHFSCDIPVETIAVSRIAENKSLVDHKLVSGISKAYYRDDVDSFILFSSDSDFWSIIEDIDARFLVMAETDSLGLDFKTQLRENNIFYGYIDKFQIPENDSYFKTVLTKEIQNMLSEQIGTINIKDIFKNATIQARGEITSNVYKLIFEKFKRNLKLKINEENEIIIDFAL